MRWAGHVELREAGEVHTGFWWGDLRDRDHFGDLGLDGKKWDVEEWTGLIWPKIGRGGGHF
jgi:hypothetical protein